MKTDFDKMGREIMASWSDAYRTPENIASLLALIERKKRDQWDRKPPRDMQTFPNPEGLCWGRDNVTGQWSLKTVEAGGDPRFTSKDRNRMYWPFREFKVGDWLWTDFAPAWPAAKSSGIPLNSRRQFRRREEHGGWRIQRISDGDPKYGKHW